MNDRSVLSGEENVDFASVNNSSIFQQDKFSELYNEGLKKMKRQDKMNSIHVDPQCTFKPKLVSKKMNPSNDNSDLHNKSVDVLLC